MQQGAGRDRNQSWSSHLHTQKVAVITGMFVISHDIWCYSVLSSAKEKDNNLGKMLTSQQLARTRS